MRVKNTVLTDMAQECFICRVEGDCNPASKNCNITRGIKLGIYPKTAHKQASVGMPIEHFKQESCGVKEKPVFALREGMALFCHQVASYDEPCLKFKFEI